MNVYLISYDLTAPDSFAHYERLIAHIKSYGIWAKPLESLWLIKTTKSAAQVRTDMRAFISPNDKLFVIDVTGRNWALFNIGSAVVQWIRKHILA